MALIDILGEYKPSGLAGGFSSGLKQGADLGHMFADTASITQQTGAREQMLPGQLSQQNAILDQTRMANDLTRATQTPEILAQKGSNVLGEEQLKGLTIDKAKELYPFQKARELHRESAKAQISMLNRMLDGIKTGRLDQIKDEMLAMVQKPEEKQAVLAEYTKAKQNPGAAAQQLEMISRTMTDRLNRTSEPEELKMWLAELAAIVDKYQANMSASTKEGSQPNYNLVFVQKLAQRIKEQNPTWTNAQVEAEAVRQYKTQNESISFDGKSSGIESSKGLPSTPTSSPMLPKTPTVPGWVKGPDGIMRKQ